MTKADKPNGGYTLTADVGRDLIVKDENGEVIARTKEVIIPAEGTLNTWLEDVEVLPVIVDEDAEKAEKIAALEAELAKLKGE